MRNTLTFDQWLAELDRVAVEEFDFNSPIVVDTGRECWRTYYESGAPPSEALAADLTHGDAYLESLDGVADGI